MKSIQRSIFLFLIFIAGILSAHNGNICSRALASGEKHILWPEFPKRPYNVIKYQLVLDWRNMFITSSAGYSGSQNIELTVTSYTDSIVLDAANLIIDSININGIALRPVPQPTIDEHLIIALPSSLKNPGSNISIWIAYHNDSNGRGIYFFPKGTYDDYLKDSTKEDLAYTMSEPIDAHFWMPCNDQPYDKAESEISIIVPYGIETASNGTLISKEPIGLTNSILWHWKSDKPIATYLMVADASTFVHWSQTHERSSIPGDTVHLDYYAWPSDYYQDSITDGTAFNAQYYLSRNTSQIMTWLEARYGGFPFVKYGQVPVSPFAFGGMEHQTITSIHRRWLKGFDQGIAHEMAHQWFGDKTTCETFKDLWLNEGFATFSEALWGEAWGGNDWYMGIIRGKSNDYFYGKLHDIPIYDPPSSDPFNGALVYAKAACVLHMLRRMVNNDTMFFNALRDYSNAFAYTTANTMQFRDFMGQRLGLDLFEYVDQWIFGRLHPIYDFAWAQDGSNRFFLRINQTQDISIRDHFTMPVKFFAYHGSSVDTLSFENSYRSQRFNKMLAYKIDSLIFDKGDLILSQDTLYYAPELDVRSEDSPTADFEVYKDGEELLCKFTSLESGIIELYNSVGIKLISKVLQNGDNFKQLNIQHLPSGIYFVRLSNSFANQTRSVTITR
jgi:aminopeptidase N